jgi:hypothetical protein
MLSRPARPDPEEWCFWLTRSMARSIGVNLTDALSANRLTSEGYGELVARCASAQCHRECEMWLAHRRADTDTAPQFCRIATELENLR